MSPREAKQGVDDGTEGGRSKDTHLWFAVECGGGGEKEETTSVGRRKEEKGDGNVERQSSRSRNLRAIMWVE